MSSIVKDEDLVDEAVTQWLCMLCGCLFFFYDVDSKEENTPPKFCPHCGKPNE